MRPCSSTGCRDGWGKYRRDPNTCRNDMEEVLRFMKFGTRVRAVIMVVVDA
jgi:hypothetical protein